MDERSFSEDPAVPEPSPAVPEPSPAARELLRAFHEHESPSATERRHGFVALQARLPARAPSLPANGRLYDFVRASLVAVTLAAAVLLAIKAVSSGVTALADRARQPATEAPYQRGGASDGGQSVTRSPQVVRPGDGAAVALDVVDAAEPTTPAASASQPPLASPAAPTAGRSPKPRAPTVSPPAANASAVEALEAELALIKRATKAKKDGRHADGLAALREHAQSFANGMLADERTVLEAELYCATGRVQEADALVETFLREKAGSALAGRMRNVCRE